jgi:hypothetical protein
MDDEGPGPKVLHWMFRYGLVGWDEAQQEEGRLKLLAFLENKCHEWIFQKEKGDETGLVHFQCYIKMREKNHLQTMINKVQKAGLAGGHVQICSTNGREALKEYSMKDDTRIDGPWTSKQKAVKRKACTVALCPWQEKMFKHFAEKEAGPRSIWWIYDETGNSGKDFLTQQLVECLGWESIAAGYKADMLNCLVSGNPHAPGFFINIPRSTGKYDFKELAGFVELAKALTITSLKYKSETIKRDKPAWILVTANQRPDKKWWSADRCVELIITDEHRAQVAQMPDARDPRDVRDQEYVL